MAYGLLSDDEGGIMKMNDKMMIDNDSCSLVSLALSWSLGLRVMKFYDGKKKLKYPS